MRSRLADEIYITISISQQSYNELVEEAQAKSQADPTDKLDSGRADESINP
ncbi:hypothetical protein H1P_1740016 [Hyella patelloides LEGE 07179]|uniref:Uncharacterized protein n=1 Tax=Hyella patelloides LEGE 07179 TaxID=945734 RepID=A0A563VNH4_9CYAN|nr:hypothetical protein [Hyella patelloides]VEP12971.1 hypothetical protein H1P_1740016 [Hyella patelloides LEGE 07179]